jgi:SAM-dependent methyltransferase
MNIGKTDTSWKSVGPWYQNLVDKKGHYYHEHLIIPGVLKMLGLKAGDSLLDLGCGQGILGRSIPVNIKYTGIDLAPNLIGYAKNLDRNPNHQYFVGDVTEPVNPALKDFNHAAIILALQNIEFPEKTIREAAIHLGDNGKLVIVLNHPCFRIPRQSSWGIDENNKMQFRRVNRYLSPLKIPINMHPGERSSPVTWTFHRPLSDYFRMLSESGFTVENLEEWSSDKESEGSASRMENRARAEIPLFLAILAVIRKK